VATKEPGGASSARSGAVANAGTDYVLVQAFLDQAPVNSAVTVAAAVLTGLGLIGAVPVALLLPWLAVQIAGAVWNYAQWRRFKRIDRRIPTASARRIRRKAMVLGALAGGLWGALAPMVAAAGPEYRQFAAIVVAAMAAGAATTLGALTGAAMAFVLAALLPWAVLFLLSGTGQGAILGVLAFVFLFAMLSATRIVHSATVAAVENRAAAARLGDELQRAQAEWLALAEANEAFALFDTRDRLVLCSRRFAALIGGGLDEHPTGAEIAARAPWHGRAVAAAPAAGWTEPYAVDLLSGGPDGSARTGYFRTSVQISPDGYRVVVHADVTELKEKEIALEGARREAVAADLAKTAFLGNMSHELRTPLNAILGFADGIRAGVFSDPARIREYASYIYLSGEHLLALVNDLLDLARIERGAIELDLEPVGAEALLEDAMALVRGAARERGVQLVTGVDGIDGGEFGLRIDRRRMRQVLVNLLTNAIKASATGAAVELRATALPAGGVRLTVRDTGRGIPAAALERLFRPFERLEDHLDYRSKSDGGTGLGLSIVRALVAAHGGRVWLESAVGIGTTAFVELPGPAA